MPVHNDDEKLEKLLKEDIAKSFTHNRQKPDTKPPTRRVTSQDNSINTQDTNDRDKK